MLFPDSLFSSGLRTTPQASPFCERHYLNHHPISQHKTLKMSKQPPKRRKCGHCQGEGNDRCTCPAIQPTQARNLAMGSDENQNGVGGRPLQPPPGPTAPPVDDVINWDQVCYVLFDLETTGGSRTDDDIIELAAMILGPDGIALEDGSFDSLIHPTKDVSTFIASLTGISNDMVQLAPNFSVVGVDFF